MKEQWKWYVYVIKCLDGTYYTGCTWNVESRLEQYVSRLGAEYTKVYGVEKIAYYEEHDDLEVARMREKQIKNWSQKKKLKLIRGGVEKRLVADVLSF